MNGYTTTNRSIGNSLLAFVGGMVVWALFGDRIKDKVGSNKTFQELRSKVMDQANKVTDMTESRYNQIVDEVSATYSKAKGISQNELQDLIADLKLHWLKIKDRWKNPDSPQQVQRIADDEFGANV